MQRATKRICMSEFEATLLGIAIAYIAGMAFVYYYQRKAEKDDNMHSNL